MSRTPKYYAIQAQRGCWGSYTRYDTSLVARVEGATSKAEALQIFRDSDSRRNDYQKEFIALSPSELSKSAKDWIENNCDELIVKKN